MKNSAISAYLGYLVDMTANNSLKIMLMPEEVQDTGLHKPAQLSTLLQFALSSQYFQIIKNHHSLIL